MSFVATLSLAALGSLLADEPPDTATAVRAVLDTQAADWNRRDLDAFAAGYWKSPKLVFQSGGVRLDGYDAMLKRYRERYQGEGRAMGKLEFRDVEVEVLGPEAALARGGWHLTMPDGKTPHGLFTLVLRKFPEGWKIIHDHTSGGD